MNKPSTIVPMRSTAVNFNYGMIVNDTDLTAAMHYPVQLMQAVNRAVYGCGIVCGFPFDPAPEICGRIVDCDPCKKPASTNQTDGKKAYQGFKVQVGRGTAIDCHGLPIEICEPAVVDVSPDKCGCKCDDGDDKTAWVCIAARRTRADEAPRGDCCDSGSEVNCARSRDHVEIKAFSPKGLPDHTCYNWPDKDAGGGGGCGCGCGGGGTAGGQGQPGSSGDYGKPMHPCDCLVQCDPCDCCGEGWVLLGCVEVCETGVIVGNFRPPLDGGGFGPYPRAPYRHRRMIKPIECRCREYLIEDPGAQKAQQAQTAQSVAELEKKIEAKVKEAKLNLDTTQMKLAKGMMRLGATEQLEKMFKEQPTLAMNMLGLRSQKTSREVLNILAGVVKDN
ncbi:hypothetical protein DEA8626_03032 [Defluviimonas aquaemixtae]|uniref:Uncharacterized protein n=1 Tax=Albidovulum aquaemixtae TaxID=1542388 RepID=A0A2R8BKQ9_9RHOB|nr:hypothetical protein [Defluviimonas aquaemixtae]SPH23955.1 hypothetical protein DEA8626_03032 [Defluviimonas aquaemixtae]